MDAPPRIARAGAGRRIATIVVTGLIVIGSGCAGDSKIKRIADDGTEENCTPAPAGGNRPGVKAVNTVCPVVDADGADESVTAEWRGKTIAFCCPTCVRKFDRMSDAEKDAMLVKATTYAAP